MWAEEDEKEEEEEVHFPFREGNSPFFSFVGKEERRTEEGGKNGAFLPPPLLSLSLCMWFKLMMAVGEDASLAFLLFEFLFSEPLWLFWCPTNNKEDAFWLPI